MSASAATNTSGEGPVVLLFHRDLRLTDHRALEKAHELTRLQTGRFILPLFVFTHDQIDRNPLKSTPAIHFMIDCLEDLAAEVKEAGGTLRFAHGRTEDVLAGIRNLVAVVETRDYTPYAKQREQKIREFCEKSHIPHDVVEDIYLTNPGSVRTGAGKVFQKFTPFWEAAKRQDVPKPLPRPQRIRWASSRIRVPHSVTLAAMRAAVGPRLAGAQRGGRTEGLKNLAAVPKHYTETHDIMAAPTSQLSAHNHFGTLSIREVFWGVQHLPAADREAFRRQLYWRDFYGHLMAAFEDLYGVGAYEFQAPTAWRRGEKEVFDAWSRAETGVPLVDAAMRQLLTTGFMHNRARMLVASWLVKDKGVHWRWGERFFARHLVDYDPAQNMMNWIWIASVLPFASAPFRRHDPDRYATRFDPDGKYREKYQGTEKKEN